MICPPPPEQNVVAIRQVDTAITEGTGRLKQTTGILWNRENNSIRILQAADTEVTVPCDNLNHKDLAGVFSNNAMTAAYRACGAPGTSFANVIFSQVTPAFKSFNGNPIGTYEAHSDRAGNVTIGETATGLQTSFSRATNGFIPEYKPTGLEGLMGSSAGRLEAARQEINIQLGMKP